MTSLCAPILLALLVLMLTLPLCQQAAPGWRSMEVLDPGSSMLTGHALGAEFTSEPRGGRFPQSAALEVHPRDVRHKEKFIRHLTGPLYFNPKCRKHFYRLYHNTRDCNVPAYYKRCARLLIRLAGSPRCMER